MTKLDDIEARYPEATRFTFGDSAALNAEILALVRAGRKTVSCDAWDAFAARGEPLPEPGRIDLALNWEGQPELAIRTVRVDKILFSEVREVHVPAQGEFRDLTQWRAGYEAYLSRAGFFHPDVDMLMETFELVEDLA